MSTLKRYTDEGLPLTPRLLYTLAVEAGMADERIRICDGMAVSYFPRLGSLARSKKRVIIDVSLEPVVEFDELSADDTGIQYRFITPEQQKEIREWLDSHAKKP